MATHEQVERTIEMDVRTPEVAVIVDSTDLAYVEALTWQNARNKKLAEIAIEDGPVSCVNLFVDGSSLPTGPFGYRAELVLDEETSSEFTEKYREWAEAAGALEFNTPASEDTEVPVSDTKADKDAEIPEFGDETTERIVYDVDQLGYRLWIGDDGKLLTIQTWGSGLNKIGEVPDRNDLHHGVDISAEPFVNFADFTQTFIGDMYALMGWSGEDVIIGLKRDVIPSSPLPTLPTTGNDKYPIPEISFADIGGLEYEKRVLMDTITVLLDPEMLKDWGITRAKQSVLLYGPEGTGQASLIAAAAHEGGMRLRTVFPTELKNRIIGESEERLDLIFRRALSTTEPFMVFFDKIDSLFLSGNAGSDASLTGAFMEGFSRLSAANPKVLVAAAANDTSNIPEEIVSQFDVRLHIPLPDEAQLTDIFAVQIEGHFKRATRHVFEHLTLNYVALAKEASGLSGDDVANIVAGLVIAKALEFNRTGMEPSLIDQDQISRGIREYRSRNTGA